MFETGYKLIRMFSATEKMQIMLLYKYSPLKQSRMWTVLSVNQLCSGRNAIVLFLFQIKVFCLHPTLKRKLDHKLEIHKDKTLTEATEMAYEVRNFNFYMLSAILFINLQVFFCLFVLLLGEVFKSRLPTSQWERYLVYLSVTLAL